MLSDEASYISGQTLVVDGAVTFFNLNVGANGAVMTGSTAGLDVDGTLTLTLEENQLIRNACKANPKLAGVMTELLLAAATGIAAGRRSVLLSEYMSN